VREEMEAYIKVHVKDHSFFDWETLARETSQKRIRYTFHMKINRVPQFKK